MAARQIRSRRHLVARSVGSDVSDVVEMAVLYQKRLSDRRGWKFAIVAHAGWDLAESFEREVVSANTIVFSLASAACGWLAVDRERTLSAIKELRKELRAPRPG